MLIIGTDEAGYGPNLGPLVVSATAWAVPPKVDFAKLGHVLRKQGIDIADSKRLYHGGDSLGALEHGVWIAHLSADKTRMTVELDDDDPCLQTGFFNEFVAETSWREVHKLANVFQTTLKSFGVRLLQLRTYIIGTRAFNQWLDECKSKGTLLSEATFTLVQNMLIDVPPEYRPSISLFPGDEGVGWGGETRQSTHGLPLNPLPKGEEIGKPKFRRNGVVLCDKHGGRNRYLDLLHRFFPDMFFQVVEESRPLSVYRSKEWEFRFQSKGESHLPIALASMFSKYFREISMLKFNAFWRFHLSGLKPTAGYPEDAKRFKADIAAVQAELGIPDDLIWRKK